MSLEGFEESLGGKWILVRNEGFDEYLTAMGEIYFIFFIICYVVLMVISLKRHFLISYFCNVLRFLEMIIF
jgi:preprotein translocase subunit SecG